MCTQMRLMHFEGCGGNKGAGDNCRPRSAIGYSSGSTYSTFPTHWTGSIQSATIPQRFIEARAINQQAHAQDNSQTSLCIDILILCRTRWGS